VTVTANAMEGDCERLLAEGMGDYQNKLFGAPADNSGHAAGAIVGRVRTGDWC
jgi:hypothetical protein